MYTYTHARADRQIRIHSVRHSSLVVTGLCVCVCVRVCVTSPYLLPVDVLLQYEVSCLAVTAMEGQSPVTLALTTHDGHLCVHTHAHIYTCI